MMTASGTIVIHRELHPSYVARAFKVKIDGVLAGRIRSGATVEFPVTPGAHEVQLSLDWNASPPLSVNVPAEWRCELTAGIGAHFDAFIRPRRYLSLRPSED